MTAMVIVKDINDIKRLSDDELSLSGYPLNNNIYVREHNIKILNCWENQICIVELDGMNTAYTFYLGDYYRGDIKSILCEIFKLQDWDTAFYWLKHSYHKGGASIGAIYVTELYSQFFNAGAFKLDIKSLHDRPLFSPFVIAKKQNIATRMTTEKLCNAILANQVASVVCNCKSTDNWGLDEQYDNWKGEWDKLDFAEYIYGSKSYTFNKDGNKLHMFFSGNEFSEDFTITFKKP